MEENIISRKRIGLLIIILLASSILFVIFLENRLYEPKNFDQYRVACVGDSITQITNYPNELQNLLGPNYTVEKFGVSGSTVLTESFRPYIDQEAFQKAKIFQPNIAIIMLGTNDANTINLPFTDNFVEDYTELIKQIQEIETKPQIFIVKPPPIYYQGSDINNTNLLNQIMPLIEQTANHLELPIIDVYEALSNHRQYFPDGVHPNNEGGKAIAQKIYQSIK